jgi:LysR family transcriptional regulator, hydrogen peroxide-inducible genes activator
LPAQQRLVLAEGHCLREQALAICDGVAKRERHGTSVETLKCMIAAGEGCSLIPALAADQSDAIAYRTLPEREYGRLIGLAWRSSDRRAAEFRELAEVLCNGLGVASDDVEVVIATGKLGY